MSVGLSSAVEARLDDAVLAAAAHFSRLGHPCERHAQIVAFPVTGHGCGEVGRLDCSGLP